jgi:hypothetical protein
MTVLALAAPAVARPHRVTVPHWDPPYDDERPETATSGALALAEPLPLPLETRPALQVVPDPPRPEPAMRHEGLPAVRPRAVALVRAIVEIMAGDRPARHLALSATLPVQERLGELVPPSSSTRRCWARTLRSVRVCELMPGVVEVSAVVDRGHRCGALALRLEGKAGAWIMTALEVA